MDLETVLDQLESGHMTPSQVSSDNSVGLGEAFFTRLIGYYGSDNGRLIELGRHWKGLLKRASDVAWIYRAGGVLERNRGRWTASADAFIAAGRTATDLVSRYSFAVGAVDSLARAGKLTDAEQHANRIARGLRRLGENGLAARAMLNLGNALVYQDRMDPARRVLSRALPDLEMAGFTLEAASARLALSSTHLFGGDPRRATEYAREVIAAAESIGADYLTDLAQLNLALALTVTGQPDQAHRILVEVGPRFSASPVDHQRVQEYMADVLFRLNLWPEAEETYRAVLRDDASTTGRPKLHQANSELGLGQSLAAQGFHDAATPHFQRAYRIYGQIHNQAWQAVTLHHQALGKFEVRQMAASRRLLARAEQLAQNSPFHLTEIWLTQSRTGIDRLALAATSIRKYGYLDLEWQVHYLRAKQKTGVEALRHYRRMFDSIVTGRLAVRSVSGRMGFLKDKTEAIREYFAALLVRPHPSRVEEVVRAIRQVRSVTLLDEMLRGGEMPEAVKDQLQAARFALENLEDVTLPGGTRRIGNSVSVVRAQRLATSALLELDLATPPSIIHGSEGVIVTETAAGVNLIVGKHLHRLPISETDLLRVLRWLAFEMAAPIADRTSGHPTDPAPAEQLLRQLADLLQPAWNSAADSVSPDAISWRIPWALCSQYTSKPKVWELAMHPGMTNRYEGTLTEHANVLIWLGNAVDLPFAQREAEAIAARFPRAQLVTSQADARKSLAGGYEVIHVVSHAIHRPNNPMLSSIQFPDGPVFAYEIAQSELRVDLATLSACDTGALSLATRSEPDGLARAFIARGAASVVASQWPLDDEAGFIQFSTIYAALMEKMDIREAISRAQCICRQQRLHPYYWGALALYSGYRSPHQ